MPKYNIRENTQYEGNKLQATHFIEIADGDYAGFRFALGKVEFLGEDEKGFARVKFDYELYDAPDSYTFSETAEERTKFEAEIGAILNDILLNMTEHNAELTPHEAGNTDSQQPDIQG